MIAELQAQDVHFSQYYFSPLTLNPAYTGKYKGDYRFFGNYRKQWRLINDAYNTFSAGGDMNFYPGGVNLSGGLVFVRDHSGGDLLVTKIVPSMAWHRKLGGFRVDVGLQPALVIKTIDFYQNSFPEQFNWEAGKFDHTLHNNETNVSQRFSYFDLASGIAISRKMGSVEAELGFALFHVNNPRESFFENRVHMRSRQAYNGQLSWQINRIVLSLHSLCGYTGKVSDWVSGGNVEYIISRNNFFNNSIFAGYMYRSGLRRNPDANIATIGFSYAQYTLGFSYDITRSQLRTSVDSRGAYEIAIIYKARNSRLTKKILPCERY